jgi:CRISPR-associated protein Cas2
MYDVRDDKRLRKVHKLMKGWGKPVQFSVFRVRLTARELERLRYELSRVLGEPDRLVVARLCPDCAERVMVHGEPIAPFDLDVLPFRMV